MSAPTAVAVTVDAVEYSRYEEDKNVITATVVITGGAPYTTEPIELELRKARRSRDAAVATASLSFTATLDPGTATATFALVDTVDQDLLNLVRHGKYFIRAEHEATSATADIGGGADGTVTITATAGVAGNSVSVEVVVPGGTSSLAVARVGDAITISLSVVGGVAVAAENTAILIAAAVNLAAYTDVSAAASGTGASSISIAEGPTTFTGGTEAIVAESGDFDIRIVTVARLKKDYLFGIPLKSTNVKMPKFEPVSITGVTFSEVSPLSPEGFGTLVYNYTQNDTANASVAIGSGADGTVTTTASGTGLTGAAGNALSVAVVVPAGTSALSAVYAAGVLTINLDVTIGVPNAVSNTATLVAAAIDALPEFTSVASGTGADSLSTAETGVFTGGTTDTIRTLSWREGPVVSITAGGTYILREGLSGPATKLLGSSSSNNYVCVVASGLAFLPTSSISEDLLIATQEITDATLGRYLDHAIAWVENDFLRIYLEPTNVVTDRDPTTIQYSAGINAPTPIFTDTDFDFLVSPLTYFVPRTPGAWVKIETPYKQLLRVDSLFGSIANTRVIDIDLEWIEHAEQSGLIQLVPFNQEIAFDFVGLLWVNAIRGAAELPNFWHFNLIAGLRDAPGELQELVGKKAAVEALQAASLAFKPGLGSLSLSRDGVSESVSYLSTQQYGVYTSSIQAYNEWIKDNEEKLRAKYLGMRFTVV